jgi:hypothetical protein
MAFNDASNETENILGTSYFSLIFVPMTKQLAKVLPVVLAKFKNMFFKFLN